LQICSPAVSNARPSVRLDNKSHGSQSSQDAWKPSPTRNLKGDIRIRFMILVKAKDSEAGVLPDEKILTEMGKYNQAPTKAGVLLAAEGLQARS
jgi:hypothetical protein